MALLTLEDAGFQGVIPEDTVLNAKVTKVAMKTAPFKDENDNDVVRMEFGFVIEDPSSPWDGTRVFGSTSTTFSNHPDCRLYMWTQEILASELEPGFVLDTDALIGQPVRVVMGVKEYEDKTTKQTRQRNQVRDLMRAKEGAVFGGLSEPF